MDALWIELVKLAGSVAGLGAATFLAYCKLRESRLTKEKGLEDNPERCGRHEEAIKNLKESVVAMETDNATDHKEIFKQLSALSLDLAKLERPFEKSR